MNAHQRLMHRLSALSPGAVLRWLMQALAVVTMLVVTASYLAGKASLAELQPTMTWGAIVFILADVWALRERIERDR